MKIIIGQIYFLLMFILVNSSCIDRDTIAGTGKLDPDKMLSAGGSFQSGIVNTKLPHPIAVRVFDVQDRPVRGVRVEFFAPNGNAFFPYSVGVTDCEGYTETFVTLGQKEDTVYVQAIVPGIKGSPVNFSLYAANAGAKNISIKSGNKQTGVVAEELPSPLVVEVKDPFDNPVRGTLVYFIPISKGKMNPSQAVTDSLGAAESYWTIDTVSGNQSAEARMTVSQSSFVSFTAVARANPVPATFEILSKDSMAGMQGTEMVNAIIVRVKDKYRNPIEGYSIRYKILSGAGSVPGHGLLSDRDGIVRCTFALDFFDSPVTTTIKGYDNKGKEIPNLLFTFFIYEYISIDSISSTGSKVFLSWTRNTNPYFLNYAIERCGNSDFDGSTLLVSTIADENTLSVSDAGTAAGSSPFYRVKINYSNGFSCYSYNIKQITVQP